MSDRFNIFYQHMWLQSKYWIKKKTNFGCLCDCFLEFGLEAARLTSEGEVAMQWSADLTLAGVCSMLNEKKKHTHVPWVSNELQIFPEESQKRNSGFSFSKVSCCHYKPGEQLCCNTEVDVVHSWCLWFWPKRRGGLRWTAATSPPSIQPMAGVCKKNTVTSSPTAALDCWAICTLVKGSLER